MWFQFTVSYTDMATGAGEKEGCVAKQEAEKRTVGVAAYGMAVCTLKADLPPVTSHESVLPVDSGVLYQS